MLLSRGLITLWNASHHAPPHQSSQYVRFFSTERERYHWKRIRYHDTQRQNEIAMFSNYENTHSNLASASARINRDCLAYAGYTDTALAHHAGGGAGEELK